MARRRWKLDVARGGNAKVTPFCAPTRALGVLAGTMMTLTIPSLGHGEGGPTVDSLRARLHSEAGPCISEEDLVVCWSSGFETLEDDVALLQAELDVQRHRNTEAQEDLRKTRGEFDLALNSLHDELDTCEHKTATWWFRHRPHLAFALATLGTAAIAGGIAQVADGGPSDRNAGLVLGGLAAEFIGLAIAW